LNFSSYIAGPYCPALLADLGAEVIKIEAHRGDQTRYFSSTLKGETRMFLGVIRNKRGSCWTSIRRSKPSIWMRGNNIPTSTTHGHGGLICLMARAGAATAGTATSSTRRAE
jgi:CoA-transferase family III